MKSSNDLNNLLRSIDHKSYPAYKDTKGVYQFPGYQLGIEHVQGDPFAAPSKLRIQVDGKKAGFPAELFDCHHKRIALQDYLLRLFHSKTEKYNFKAKGSGKSGLISVSRCGQEILERTSCEMDQGSGTVAVRLEVGFPANGRTINASELVKVLFDFLPKCVEETLYYGKYSDKNKGEVKAVKELAEDQEAMRRQLPEMGLAAFIANGSILPRESGVSDKPMRNAVPFISPASMEMTMELPYRGSIKGMGIKKGVNLIIGGGYHGKSTLLKALELGVYPHLAQDGREFVVTDATAVKLRAEDGRSVRNVDISLFINNLPNKKDTVNFYTEDASGSTSQAANVIEGIEAGTGLFLIDEDTSATNFMIRDELMQRVVSRNQEPITPFIDRVRALYEEFGISTIIVAGSSGAYFHAADSIIQMEHYVPADITRRAREAAADFPAASKPAAIHADITFPRRPVQNPVFKSDRLKMKTGRDYIQIEQEGIDLRYVEQLTDNEQLWALGYLLKYAEIKLMDGKKDMRQIVDCLMKEMEEKGLASIALSSYLSSPMAKPRRQDIFACFNRYRRMDFK